MWQCTHVAFELFFFLFLDYVYARSSIGICSTSHKSQVAATDYSVGTRHNNMADKMQPRQFFPGTEGGTTIQYMFRISVDSFSQQRKGEKSNHKVESCVCIISVLLTVDRVRCWGDAFTNDSWVAALGLGVKEVFKSHPPKKWNKRVSHRFFPSALLKL